MVLGDFNEILYSLEKEGGNASPNAMMKEFRDCLAECGLDDMGYIGDPFTWRRGDIRERLDRRFVMWSGPINFLVLRSSMRNMYTLTIAP